MKTINRMIVIILGAISLAGCAASLPPSVSMPTGDALTTLPPGYNDGVCNTSHLCQRVEIAIIPMAAAVDDMLRQVNSDENRSVVAAPDIGNPIYWRIADSGDCKTYAVAKLRDLVDHGLPRGALHLAILRTETGDGHAVLTVDTSRGTYVLDNRYPEPAPWATLPYSLWTREGTPGTWAYGPVTP